MLPAYLGPLELARVLPMLPEMRDAVLPLMQAIQDATGKRVSVPADGGVRSYATQTKLLADRDAQGETYDVATPGKSYHEYGAAVDLHIAGGTDADYRTAAQIATERFGLTAGLYFHTVKPDPYHFQLGYSLATVQAMWADYEKKKQRWDSWRSWRPSSSCGVSK